MYYAKYFADNLETYTDEDTGLTHHPDGSVTDITGARFYPGDDLWDAVTFYDVLAADVLDDKL